MANAFAANLYHYRGSSIVAEKGRSIRQCLTEATRRKNLTGFGARLAFKSAPRAGDRAPDAGKLSIDDRTEIRLFGLWKQDPRLKLLILSGLTARPERWAVLRKLAEEMKNVYTDWIDVLFIAPYDIGGQDMIDGEAELHDRYGASDECMYLIRPDGYVSFRSQPVDADALSKHLQASLGISALRPTGR